MAPNPQAPFNLGTLTDIHTDLLNINKSLQQLIGTVGNDYISLSGNNVFTGTNTFKLPPVINAGAVGTATLLPAGMLSKQLSIAGVGNGADTTDDTLFSYSLPANALDATGRSLRIRAFGSLGATANNKTFKLFFGSTVVFSSGVITGNNVGWLADLMVAKTGSNTQLGTGSASYSTTPIAVPKPIAGSETDTGAITIKVTGASPTTGAANDVLANGLFVEYFN